jgi:hypothetical protein
MDDEAFLRAFESCTLTPEEWRHRSHLKVAYLYLRRHGLAGATEKIPAAIKALNAAHKNPESLDRGYHHTITIAWLRIMHTALQEYGPAETADAFLDQQPHLLEKKILRLFYSRDRIMSWQAKAEFVEPDLALLPVSKSKPSPANTQGP